MDDQVFMDDTTSDSDEEPVSDSESTFGDDVREDSREEYMVQLYLASGVNEDRFRETINPVDGSLTCCFSIDCLEPWREGSAHCAAHHREVAHAYLSQPTRDGAMYSLIYFAMCKELVERKDPK